MGLLTPLAVDRGIPWLPRFLPQIMWFDKMLQRVTRGRFTVLDMAGLPNIMLTAIGRKSGKPRDTPLLCVPDGEDILIAGSNFGGKFEPIWVKNIEANPEVTVRFDEATRPSRRAASRVTSARPRGSTCSRPGQLRALRTPYGSPDQGLSPDRLISRRGDPGRPLDAAVDRRRHRRMRGRR